VHSCTNQKGHMTTHAPSVLDSITTVLDSITTVLDSITTVLDSITTAHGGV
jgi:hypothetical protein